MSIERERLMRAVRALTGQWLDDATCDKLIKQAGSREELLAHGVIDLRWLRGNPQVFARFQAIAANAAVAPDPQAHKSAGPRPIATSMSREESRRMLHQFQEDPTAIHPFERLRRMAVELYGKNL